MSNTDCLVVTPTTGASDYLDETVASLNLMPTSRFMHTIACPESCRGQIEKKYPESQVVTESAPSMYAAINDGARQTEGWSWLTYINDDDYFLPDVKRFVEEVTTTVDTSTPTIVYSRVDFVGPDRQRICEFPVMHRPENLLDCYRIACNPLATHGTMINRSAFERLGGFDASFRYVGDMDFFVRALQMHVRFVFMPYVTTAFRLHGSNLTSEVEPFTKEEERVRAKIQQVDGRLSSKLLRLRFIMANRQSYWDRWRTVGRLKLDSYLAELSTKG